MPDDLFLPRHGGALAAASARYGMAPDDWLDLSTGINPAPFPTGSLAGVDFARLPDPAALALLRAAAASAYAAPAAVRIVPVPGSDIALRLLPLLKARGRAAILSPTYSGHAEGWRAAGHEVVSVSRLAEAEGVDTIILANPNNPDGRITAPAAIRAALVSLPNDGMLLIDEAFADLDPQRSLVGGLADDPRLVILRSFGKFYGLAGLRLGFVLGSGEAVRHLEALAGDWPVSGPAIAIGRRALLDGDWQRQTRARLAASRIRLDELLARQGLSVQGGTDLFRLVDHADAAGLHEHLARKAIWTRIFADRPRHIRFGLPRDNGFARLGAALAD